jgi:phosphoribosyl 1,2-cyclic phosphate phosphodiesterase
VCQSTDPRNNRTRCGAIVGLPSGNLLIDTPPDLRFQLLRERIGIVHAVLYTHEHADHIFGLDDLRLFQFYLDKPLELYCEEIVGSAFADRSITRSPISITRTPVPFLCWNSAASA